MASSKYPYKVISIYGLQGGAKSQTVNICTCANINGQYDYIVRLSPPFISTAMLLNQDFSSLADQKDHQEEYDDVT